MKKTVLMMAAVMCCVAVSAQNRKNASHVRGYSPSVEAGVSLNEYYTVPYVTTSQGYCFGNGLYIGGVAGVSFNSAEINGKSSRVLIPLLAEIKYSFIDRLASPFIGLKGGGILDCTALGIGYIVRPYVGVDIWRFSLSVGVDYETATYATSVSTTTVFGGGQETSRPAGLSSVRIGNTGIYIGLSYRF